MKCIIVKVLTDTYPFWLVQTDNLKFVKPFKTIEELYVWSELNSCEVLSYDKVD